MGWKKLLEEKDPELYLLLVELIKETHKYREIYRKAKDPAKAQLWLALALLYKKIKEKKKNGDKITEEVVKELEEKF